MNNLQEIIQKSKELKTLIQRSKNVYSAEASIDLLSKLPNIQVNIEGMLEYIEQAKVKYSGDGYYRFDVEVDGVAIIAVADGDNIEKHGLQKYIEGVKGE